MHGKACAREAAPPALVRQRRVTESFLDLIWSLVLSGMKSSRKGSALLLYQSSEIVSGFDSIKEAVLKYAYRMDE